MSDQEPKSSFSDRTAALNFHRNFEDRVNQGNPDTFGPSTNLYNDLLEQTRLETILKNFNARVALLGITAPSAHEFVDFVKTQNSSASLFGIDISSIALSRVQARDTGIKLVQSDGLRLGFADESLDVIFTHLLFHNLPKPIETSVSQLLRESYRVLKPGGGIISIEWENYDSLLSNTGFQHVLTEAKKGMSRISYDRLRTGDRNLKASHSLARTAHKYVVQAGVK